MTDYVTYLLRDKEGIDIPPDNAVIDFTSGRLMVIDTDILEVCVDILVNMTELALIKEQENLALKYHNKDINATIDDM